MSIPGKEELIQLVTEKFEGSDCFLVDIKIGPGKISVFVDKPAGITIGECADLNRFLRERFENSELFEKHELEVGSPGMDQPLKVLKQFQKRIGREMKVITTDGLQHSGILKNAGENGIDLAEIITE